MSKAQLGVAELWHTWVVFVLHNLFLVGWGKKYSSCHFSSAECLFLVGFMSAVTVTVHVLKCVCECVDGGGVSGCLCVHACMYVYGWGREID